MKTFFRTLIVSTMTLTMLCFVSCGTKEKRPQADQSLLLLEQLEAYNAQFVGSAIQTRGVLRFIAVTSADVMGAYEMGKIGAEIGLYFGLVDGAIIGAGIGGAIGAVGASYVAYKGTGNTAVVPNSDSAIDSENAWDPLEDLEELEEAMYSAEAEDLIPDLNEIVDTLGLYVPQDFKSSIQLALIHNAILDKVINKDNDSLIIEENYLTENEKNIIYSDTYISKYSSLVSKIKSLSPNEYITGIGLEDRIMALFLNIFNTEVGNTEDLISIINAYGEKIERSDELTMNEKTWIYNGLCVAAYSYEYWSKKLDQ